MNRWATPVGLSLAVLGCLVIPWNTALSMGLFTLSFGVCVAFVIPVSRPEDAFVTNTELLTLVPATTVAYEGDARTYVRACFDALAVERDQYRDALAAERGALVRPGWEWDGHAWRLYRDGLRAWLDRGSAVTHWFMHTAKTFAEGHPPTRFDTAYDAMLAAERALDEGLDA